jgi:hypothetical protein
LDCDRFPYTNRREHVQVSGTRAEPSCAERNFVAKPQDDLLLK